MGLAVILAIHEGSMHHCMQGPIVFFAKAARGVQAIEALPLVCIAHSSKPLLHCDWGKLVDRLLGLTSVACVRS